MPFQFHIRPVGEIEQGYELTCDGLFPRRVRYSRFIEAVIHAVQIQVGQCLPGEIQVHGCDGSIVETLPLQWEGASYLRTLSPELEKKAA